MANTLRDEFAIAALSGLLTHRVLANPMDGIGYRHLVQRAYTIADAMVEEKKDSVLRKARAENTP